MEILANIAIIAIGIAEGWSSPSVFLLTSVQSPLPSGKITMEEATWIASLFLIGCMFGNFFSGFIAKKFGRKTPLLIISNLIIVSENTFK